jgi:diguanylate cyclase (GGDEF)-like protein
VTSSLSDRDFARLVDPIVAGVAELDVEVSVRDVVLQILRCAQTFVPCEAGSVMLSQPQQEGALVFAASFGNGSDQLVGKVLPPNTGFAGQVFRTGKPVMTNRPARESTHYREIDKITQNQTQSLLVVPVRVFDRTVGVLSLLNATRGEFLESDLGLINVFTDYLTHSLQLMIEARKERQAAMIDHLTGLFNDRFLYRYLQETIETAMEGNQDVGLIFMDLDRFKAVVDTHGHLVGSQMLREIGRMIGELSDRYGAVAARYGGDEYVVVLPGGQAEQVRRLAEEIRHTIETAAVVCEGEPGQEPILLERRVTASIGASSLQHLKASCADSIELRQHLIREADKAMYVAKAKGKNCVHWAPDEVGELPPLPSRR